MYIEALSHIIYYHWGKENYSLYQGLSYIKVLYLINYQGSTVALVSTYFQPKMSMQVDH